MEKQMNLLERFQRYMRNSEKREKSIVSFSRTLTVVRKWLLDEYGVDIFNEQSVIKCSAAMMDDWYNTCIVKHDPPYSTETKKSYTLAVQRFFNFLILYHVIDKQNDPTTIIPKQKHAPIEPDISPDKIYSPEEIKTMFTKPYYAHNAIDDLRFKAMIALLLESGLRAFEVCSITVGQMRNCRNNVINVERKGGTTKPVIIGSAAWPYIRAYYKAARENAKDNEALFVTKRNNPYTPHSMYVFITHRQEYIGIAHPGIHNFRHTAISNVAQSGNIVAARDFAGHSSVTMTNRYMHTKEEARQNIVNDTEMSRIMNEISEGHMTAASSTPHPTTKVEKRYPTTIEELADWEDDDDDDEDEDITEVPEISDTPNQSNWWDELDDPSDLTEEDFDI